MFTIITISLLNAPALFDASIYGYVCDVSLIFKENSFPIVSYAILNTRVTKTPNNDIISITYKLTKNFSLFKLCKMNSFYLF